MLARILSLTVVLALHSLSGCREPVTSFGSANASHSIEFAPDESDAFFSRSQVVELKLELTEDAVKSLRENPRFYVKAKLTEGGSKEYADVGMKLKGAAGSFQEFDGKPGLTLHASKFLKSQRFHAMEKFHLNNSVQDESYLCERIAGELCREAGVPAPRVTHAHVWLNDRDLGLYVFKEGFDAAFLKRHFEDSNGNLYDGGFCTDINEELEKDSGKGPDDLSDLRQLQAACEIGEASGRAEQIEKLLDVDAFINFMALELMMGHWDGYTANKNNYRVYFDPSSKKARFLPHGMDQMFQDSDFPVLMHPGTVVGAAVMSRPEWRQRYRQRVSEILPRFSSEALEAKVNLADKSLIAYFQKLSQDEARNHDEVVRHLKERLVARAGKLREQILQPDTGPPMELAELEFDDAGVAEISNWYPHEPQDNRLEQEEVSGQRELTIAVGDLKSCYASWRERVSLRQGKYQFEAEMKAEGIVAIVDDRGSGGGVRISGSNRENAISDDSDWQRLTFEFEVGEEVSEVQLVAELRATKGKLRIKLPLRVRRIN